MGWVEALGTGGGIGGDGVGDGVTILVAKTESDQIIKKEESRANGSATTASL